jgi:4-oxalocrotonate tautomerase
VPLVTVKVIEGVFTPTQKQEMIRKLTDTMVAIEGENMRPVTWVVVEEVKSGDWGSAAVPSRRAMSRRSPPGSGAADA